MSVWMEKTVEWMWVVVSVFIMVLAVVFGVMKNADLRLAVGDVTFGVFAPVWVLMTAAAWCVMLVRRRREARNSEGRME